jgi:hypothetical protein
MTKDQSTSRRRISPERRPTILSFQLGFAKRVHVKAFTPSQQLRLKDTLKPRMTPLEALKKAEQGG